MTKKKQKVIINWMCKHWQNDDIFDDAVQMFGKSKEVINFCEKIATLINKALTKIPSYLEKEIKK